MHLSYVKITSIYPGSQTRSLRTMCPWYLHLLNLLVPNCADSTSFTFSPNLFSPFHSYCPLKVKILILHNLDEIDGLLLNLSPFSTPVIQFDAATKMVISLIFWEPPQYCPMTFKMKNLLLSLEQRVVYNQASAYLSCLSCHFPPSSQIVL